MPVSGPFSNGGPLFDPAPLAGPSPRNRRVPNAILNECYGARQQADCQTSAGLGFVCYDGAGKTARRREVLPESAPSL